MAEKLYIRLGSQIQDNIQWLITSPTDDEIIASGELENAHLLSELTEKAQQRLVTVFVPSTDVALKSLFVPSKSSRAMKLAAPYMLEDELAQEVEQLFFAYGNVKQNIDREKSAAEKSDGEKSEHKNSEPNNCFIAAVERSLVEQWLTWLNDAEISCKVMIPDVLAMPLVDHNEAQSVNKPYSAITVNQQLIVRQGPWQGFTIDLPAWPIIAKQLGKTQDNKEAEAVIIHAYSELPNTPENIVINPQPEELPLALLAQHSKNQPFNLLQGEFLVKEQRSPVLSNWLWAAGIALFALLFNLGLKGTQLIQLNAQQDIINEQIVSQYKKAFPETKRVRVNTIKSQLKRKLAQVGGGDNQAGFLAMLTLVRPAFFDVPELKPESLKFDGKRQEIRINAVASDYSYFEKFKTSLEKSQLTVNQGAQNNQGDQVSGSFSISSKAAKKKSSKTRGKKS